MCTRYCSQSKAMRIVLLSMFICSKTILMLNNNLQWFCLNINTYGQNLIYNRTVNIQRNAFSLISHKSVLFYQIHQLINAESSKNYLLNSKLHSSHFITKMLKIFQYFSWNFHNSMMRMHPIATIIFNLLKALVSVIKRMFLVTHKKQKQMWRNW